jgi:outer membrane protein OmpA-like peptidoglycan-associated protein
LAELCLRAFSRSDHENVSFRKSSTEIRTPSYAALDALINIAYDCHDMTIAITGHSDSSGYEVTNRRLSFERAQAVADYLARGGLATDRLLVTGAGSLFPVAENSNALGRSLNRRIEIEMLPAQAQTAL